MAAGKRAGMLGALMDEYERAAADLEAVLESLSDEGWEAERDRDTDDEDCRSIRTVMFHVLRATYGYADDLRVAFGMEKGEREAEPQGPGEASRWLRRALEYTEETLDGRWGMTEKEAAQIQWKTSWGTVYDVEQMLEHAIVHILRHRRQIEGFLADARA